MSDTGPASDKVSASDATGRPPLPKREQVHLSQYGDDDLTVRPAEPIREQLQIHQFDPADLVIDRHHEQLMVLRWARIFGIAVLTGIFLITCAAFIFKLQEPPDWALQIFNTLLGAALGMFFSNNRPRSTD